MPIKNYNGVLNPNEIFASIVNMIISQEVFVDNIDGGPTSLVEKARVDGTLYGDTKVYYAADALASEEWGADAEAANLLALHRPGEPKTQTITLDIFRQISLTVDNYLTKRAFSDEYTFSDFNGVMLAWIQDTKKVYDATTYNTFIGTDETAVGKQQQVIDITKYVGDATGEEKNRLEASAIAEHMSDLFVEMSDYSRDFNDYEFLRSIPKGKLTVVWNSLYSKRIEKRDLPTIFHKEGLMEKMDSEILPSRYFGKILTKGGTTGAQNATIRSLKEKVYGGKHCFAGDLLPNSTPYLENECYEEDPTIICKIMVKLPPYMSAFQVGTSFFNAKSLTENHYLTWGHNSLVHFHNYPMVTVRESKAKAA